MKLSLMSILDYTTSDGPGFRTSIYCAGCSHQCKNCQNPQTWNMAAGTPTDIEEIYNHVVENEMSDVTFSGGDPLFQPKAFTELAKMIKQNTNKTIWCYTGFTIEQILQNPMQAQILPWIDVLVDGRFVEELKDPDLLFRGSSNQRLIDVKKTLKKGKVVLYDYDPFNLMSPATDSPLLYHQKESLQYHEA